MTGNRRFTVGAAVLAAFLGGRGFAQPTPPAPPAPAPAPPAILPAAPLTPEELAELDEVEKVGDRYVDEARNQQKRIKAILRREYKERLAELEGRYKKGMDLANKDYKTRHLSAMAELERFLARYPDDPKWSPDAMFRLADLYLDQAGIEWEEKQLLAQAAGTPPPDEDVDPDAPTPYAGPDYTRAIDLWRDLVKRFPTYRQIDGTLYLLAYYLGEMGQTAEAKQAYLGLVCANKYDPLAVPPPAPDAADRPALSTAAERAAFVDPYTDCTPRKEGSAINDESWVRIGEAHFDARGELNLAIAAYKRVASKKDSEFYDEALYKLAWSYYRNDQFIEGINAFDELVVYSDKMEEEGKGSVELRQEAVDYIAISFSDPWEENAQPDPAKSMERAHAYYDKRLGERHVRDVFEKLGDTLLAGEAHDQSIDAWRVALDKWPLHPRNPVVHQKIVDALADKGDAEGAAEERRKLAVAYRKGTPWYSANETNREAMDFAQRLAESSLLATAKATHRSAKLAADDFDKTKNPDSKAEAMRLYSLAAQLYAQYLQEFPTSNEAYELTYRMADCLFFAEQYIESVPHYRWVRDAKGLGTKYFEPSALSVVQAYQAAVDKAKAAGQLVEPPLPTTQSLAASSAPVAIPELYKGLQQAYDEYMTIIADQKTAPKMALASAMISYKHLQLDDALGRFKVAMEKFCGTPEASEAKDGMLVVYQFRNDNENFKATNDRFINKKCGDEAAIALAGDQNRTIEFQEAGKLFADGKYEAAALAFWSYYKKAPDKDKSRDAALFNAALAYQKADRPKTAVALFGEMAKNPQFKDSQYFVEAVFYTAASFEGAFDYDNAVDNYLEMVEIAGEAGRKYRQEFDMPARRLDAMWNAAVLRERDHRYNDQGRNDPGAITLFRRYAATDLKNRKRSSDGMFRVALIYEKAGDTKNMIKGFADWRRGYGGDAGNGTFLVLSQYKTAKALEKQRDKKGADQYYRETIKAFDLSGEKPKSDAAELAGEAQFWLAEQEYKRSFETYKVVWKGKMTGKDAEKNVKATLDGLAKKAKDAVAGYQAVARFESSWSLAAIVRLGDVAWYSADKLIMAAPPTDIVKLDKKYPDQNILAQYQEGIDAQVAPQKEDAKTLWEKAVTTAKAAGVSNEFSKLAQTRLNSFVASDLYPVQREDVVEKESNP